ncbi:acetyl-CoA carboxylase carboxyl transferase subunit beta [Arthrobacter sp. cf158]|nr:acetyl-CoA carboxylase carboxyl transferase subunit beta [Arthrobacter sp. cf158]
MQVTENLFNKGLIDGVVNTASLADLVNRALRILMPHRYPVPSLAAPSTLSLSPAEVDAWTSIGITRQPRRPDLRQLLKYGATDALPLSGTGQGEKDPGLLLALARFGT